MNRNAGPTECTDEGTVNAVSIRAGINFTSPLDIQHCHNVLPDTVDLPGVEARVEFLTADYNEWGFVAEYFGGEY